MSGTTERGFANLANIGASQGEKARIAEINAGIDATMREVIAGARYCPNALDAPISRVTPVGAVPVAKAVGERWLDARPLEVPGGATAQRLIEGLVNTFQPHGTGNPLAAVRERRSPAAEARLASAVEAARATLLEALAEPERAAPEPVLAAPAPEPAARVPGTITRRRLA
jgi:hypothetical protein